MKVGTEYFTYDEECQDCKKKTKVNINGFCKDCKNKGLEDFKKLNDEEIIETENPKDIVGFCANCEKELGETEIFEGMETSYICNNCGYEGYNWNFNTKIKEGLEDFKK